MYVFDPREKSGYLFKAPEWVCRVFCRVFRKYDYWYNA